jgi:hypothetical protein
MRKDFEKVIHEYGKYGSDYNTKKGDLRRLQSFDPEALPSREAMRPKKWLRYTSYRSAPLARFLRSRLGKNWDEIWKEICEVFSKKTEKPCWGVETTVEKDEEGHLYISGKYLNYRQYLTGPDAIRGTMYVDPDTKVLRESEGKSGRQRYRELREAEDKELSEIYRKISDTIRLIKKDGVWYEVILKKISGEFLVKDVWFNDTYYTKKYPKFKTRHSTEYLSYHRILPLKSCKYGRCIYDGYEYYAVEKRQINKRELRKYGLK